MPWNRFLRFVHGLDQNVVLNRHISYVQKFINCFCVIVIAFLFLIVLTFGFSIYFERNMTDKAQQL